MVVEEKREEAVEFGVSQRTSVQQLHAILTGGALSGPRAGVEPRAASISGGNQPENERVLGVRYRTIHPEYVCHGWQLSYREVAHTP